MEADRSLVLAAAGAPLARPAQGALTDYDVVLMYLEDLRSPRSRQTMLEALGRAAAALGAPGDGDEERVQRVAWTRLTYAATSAIKNKLLAARGPNVAPFAPSTVRLTLSSVAGVLRTAAKLGIITYDEAKRATSWGRVEGFRLPAGRALDDAEVDSVRSWCLAQEPPFGPFALGIFAVLLRAGLRREELCALPLASYEDGALKVIGKGDKERMVPLSFGARSDIDRWIAERERIGMRGPWMFQRVYRNGRIRTRPLKATGVWNLCALVSRELGGKSFSPHDCRRTFVSGLLDRGVDLAIVQRLAGHSSPKTTTVYDRRPERAAREAIEGLVGW